MFASAKHPHALVRVVRLVLVGAVACVGWNTFSTVQTLLQSPGPDARAASALVHPADPLNFAALVEQSGGWSVLGEDVYLSFARLSPADARRRVRRNAETTARPLSGTLSFSRQLQSLAKASGAKRHERKDGTITYVTAQETWSGRVDFRRQDGQERAVRLCVATALAPDEWMWVEARGVDADAVARRADGGHLGLPAGAEVICTRFSPAGQPLLEIVRAGCDRGRLIEFWNKSGWNVRPVLKAMKQSCVVCTRHGASATAWWPPEESGDRSLVMISHQPSP